MALDRRSVYGLGFDSRRTIAHSRLLQKPRFPAITWAAGRKVQVMRGPAMRGLLALTCVLALSGCASTPAEKPASLNIVYVVGDHPEALEAATAPNNKGANPEAASDSTLKQLFWPLSGR